MSIKMTVYRTAEPVVFAIWEDWQREMEAWKAGVFGFIRRHFGDGRDAIQVQNFSGVQFVGVHHWSNEIPEGWRLDRKNWCLVPLKKNARGKEIAREMDAVRNGPRDPRDRFPGMPSFIFGAHSGGFGTISPRIEVHTVEGVEYTYVVWKLAAEQIKPEPDPEIWERVKASEYMAMLEVEAE